ncbi:ComEC/Rec2 family competence protein [Clostridium sp. YIM B02551]|uniref:ComEC/Rec2 family competence protein n=1 Tax=Clostridium sp. YIM B02551 TaxID=2910679 RepID=UPI001EEB7699|nr:MBL fold metallo-hydrolase [Clostridium sp. YIM B02551]
MRKIYIFLLSVFLAITCSHKYVLASDLDVKVHFIDTGQSDCILIENGEKSYLIDSGEEKNSAKILSYLNKHGINKLDFIILTHYHQDHYGGLFDITSKIKTNMVYVPRYCVVEEEKNKALSSLLKNKISYKVIEKEWKYKDGLVDLKVLAPSNGHDSLENNNSLVIKGILNGKNYLFMADCEFDEEKDLLSRDIENIDVLKLGHHGFDTSSSEELLRIINPKYTIITCDGNESPEIQVIDRLKRLDTVILRTDRCGDIEIINSQQKNLQMSL